MIAYTHPGSAPRPTCVSIEVNMSIWVHYTDMWRTSDHVVWLSEVRSEKSGETYHLPWPCIIIYRIPGSCVLTVHWEENVKCGVVRGDLKFFYERKMNEKWSILVKMVIKDKRVKLTNLYHYIVHTYIHQKESRHQWQKGQFDHFVSSKIKTLRVGWPKQDQDFERRGDEDT